MRNASGVKMNIQNNTNMNTDPSQTPGEMANDVKGEGLDYRSHIQNLSPNPGAKLLRYGKTKEGVISLAQGEGDAPTPEFIRNAAIQALQEGKTFYGMPLGLMELREELTQYYKRIYEIDLPVNRAYVTSSGSKAMNLALQSLIEKGDEVVAVTPIWKNLLNCLEVVEANIIESPMDFIDGKWSLDLDKLFASCTDKTRAILITTPSNPTGWVMEKDQMQAVLDYARKHGIWLISDEVYGRLTYDRLHAPSFLEISDPHDRLYTVNNFSKAWAMTGWRLGWLVGPQGSEGIIQDVANYDYMCPPSFSQYGAMAALQEGEPFLQELLTLWQGNMDFMFDAFATNDRIIAKKPDAAFYAFLRVEGETDSVAFARRLIDDYAISLAPGSSFGRVGEGFMRFCFATSRPKLEEAIGRFMKAVDAL